MQKTTLAYKFEDLHTQTLHNYICGSKFLTELVFTVKNIKDVYDDEGCQIFELTDYLINADLPNEFKHNLIDYVSLAELYCEIIN